MQMLTKPARDSNYSDLDLDFLPNPGTKDVSILVGDEAIRRAIRNIILTNFYDKPFRPSIGSSVIKLLFENVTPITINFLKNAIVEVITSYEPRVELRDVSITFKPDNNGFEVTMTYVILNTLEPIISTVFLERVR